MIPEKLPAVDLAQRQVRQSDRFYFRPRTSQRRSFSSRSDERRCRASTQGKSMLSVIIGVLIICVVGAICFWAIDRFVNESRLAVLLKFLVVLICLGAILQRVLPLAGINWL
jgi:F0F1-type ATP synthase assembly protein I